MEGKNDAFINKLDELITLFEQLKNKANKEGIILENDPLYKNFEMLASNYQLIKNNLPDDLLQEIGEPMQEMIVKMVEQLKSEMSQTDSKKSSDIKDELQKIDLLLKKGNLSEQEINDLLDKRSKL